MKLHIEHLSLRGHTPISNVAGRVDSPGFTCAFHVGGIVGNINNDVYDGVIFAI